MRNWTSMSVLERSLIRDALLADRVDAAVAGYGVTQRWEAVDGAPQRDYTAREAAGLAPRVAAAALALVEAGLIEIRKMAGLYVVASDPVLDLEAVRTLAADPSAWAWSDGDDGRYGFTAPPHVYEAYYDLAFPFDPTGPGPDEHTPAQHEVLLCSIEASGMLTGFFGILAEPPADFAARDEKARLAWADEALAELLPFVRDGYLEVRLSPGEGSYEVIPAHRLRDAFANRAEELWPPGEEFLVGATCVPTFAGIAMMRTGERPTGPRRA